MTYTLTRYQSYQEYLDNCTLGDGDYRLLSTGEVIQLPPEDDRNRRSAVRLSYYFLNLPGLMDRVCIGDTELEVNPIGDKRRSRKPDVMILQPEHLTLLEQVNYSSVRLGMPAPALVVEVVSRGSDTSDNYKRDYIWKREQYQWWGIPEYWIVDRQRGKVTVLRLVNDVYQETVHTGDAIITSTGFPALKVVAKNILVQNG